MHPAVSATLAVVLASTSTSIDPLASAVVKRTHDTRSTYSLYVWTKISPPRGEPFEEWAAEFNRGSMHRVETPRDRVVADCARMTGTLLHVGTGEMVRSPEIAAMACGIDPGGGLVSSKWLGRVETRFGPADKISLTFANGYRTYEVATNGALLAETIAGPGGDLRLINSAIAMSSTTPAGDIFTEGSLQRSVVPEQYRRNPKTSLATVARRRIQATN